MEDEVLTKKQALAYLKISRKLLDDAVKNREISIIRFKRKILFRKKDLDEFLESKLIPKKK